MVVLVDATVIPPKCGILLSQLKPKDPASGRGMTNSHGAANMFGVPWREFLKYEHGTRSNVGKRSGKTARIRGHFSYFYTKENSCAFADEKCGYGYNQAYNQHFKKLWPKLVMTQFRFYIVKEKYH